MKIDSVTLEALRARIEPLDTPERRAAYREGRYARAELVKDPSQRYRWDLFWASRSQDLWPKNADSTHMDTALRRIVSPL